MMIINNYYQLLLPLLPLVLFNQTVPPNFAGKASCPRELFYRPEMTFVNQLTKFLGITQEILRT